LIWAQLWTGWSLVAERNFDFYEARDGKIHKFSRRASRGETVDDSDVADLLVHLDDYADDGSDVIDADS
jgi:hypothetical protein